MSDYKPNENRRPEDMDELTLLLQELDKKGAIPRYTPVTTPVVEQTPVAAQTPAVAQVAVAAEPVSIPAPQAESLPPVVSDDGVLQPARFQPTIVSAQDSRALLLNPGEPTLEMNEYQAVVQEMEEELTLPDPPPVKMHPMAALWAGFCNNFPHAGDSVGTKVRKCGFLTALLVMLVALAYLAMDLLVIPAQNTKLKNELISTYHPERSQVISEQQDGYPKKMLASFQELYNRNPEVRGWISFHADGKKDFLDIEYPIVYSGDNEKYLDKDFDGNKNRNGTLFFDKENNLNSYRSANRSLIVYGHNMASGQMFAGLNKFLGNVNNARSAPMLTLSTLFREDQYVVFAVIMTDESDEIKGRYFNTRRTEFESDADFNQYVADIQSRSLFNYPVDVHSNDQLLVLSTCTSKSTSKLKNGRMVVVARRMRDGEKLDKEHTTAIVKNEDVIMPYYWYINQGMTPHSYYATIGKEENTPSTAPSKDSTTTTVDSTTTTTVTNSSVIGPTTIDSDFFGESTTGIGESTTLPSGTVTTTTGNAFTTATTTYPYYTYPSYNYPSYLYPSFNPGYVTNNTNKTSTTTTNRNASTTTPTTSKSQSTTTVEDKPTATTNTGKTTTTTQSKPTASKQTNPTFPSTSGTGIPSTTYPSASTSKPCSHAWDNECDTTCNLGCGWVRNGHVFDNACDGICNLGCGFTRKVNHAYSNDCDPTCNRCGSQRTVAHDYEIVDEKAATCQEAGYISKVCAVCGFTPPVETLPAKHEPESVKVLEDACVKDGRRECVCKHCGETYIETIPATGKHVYEDEDDTDCNVCGSKRK